MHARAPRARVKILTRTFGQPMIFIRINRTRHLYAHAISHARITVAILTFMHAHVSLNSNCNPNYTRKDAQVDAILIKTGLNNVLLPTLFIAVNNIEQYCYTRFRLNNIVDKCEQRGQQNIVQSC